MLRECIKAARDFRGSVGYVGAHRSDSLLPLERHGNVDGIRDAQPYGAVLRDID